MATTYPSHPKETPPAPAPKPGTHDPASLDVNKGGLQNDASPEARNPNPTLVDGQPALKEGMEPEADRVPFHGGGFAKVGGAYPGGVAPPEPPPPPEGDTHASKTARK